MSIPLPENFDPRNKEWIIRFTVIGVVFLAGRGSVSGPEKSKVCKAEIREMSLLKDKVVHLERETVNLKELIASCEDSTDKRLRDQADLAAKECEDRIASTLKLQKERFLKFKCAECKKRGLCK